MGSTPSALRNAAISKDSFEPKDPMSLYFPWQTISKKSFSSIISTITRNQQYKDNLNFSRRTLILFALILKNKIEQIKNLEDNEQNQKLKARAEELNQWFTELDEKVVNWEKINNEYQDTKNDKYTEMGRYFGIDATEPYFELHFHNKIPGVRKSRELMKESRPDGFNSDELKVYWCLEQIQAICNENEQKSAGIEHDTSDEDVLKNLEKNPIKNRSYSGNIEYITEGIEKAVFHVPEEAQIILLNFANEMSPGGGYLRGAIAQEEVLLFNSDGYVSLLDLKYRKMGGGYAIPEFGLAYVKDIKIFDTQNSRAADMLVAACYCLDHDQLYTNPRDDEEWFENNLAKFKAFLAAAVANSKGDGSNTYLLLGPIGTGAFGNDTKEIGKVFREALKSDILEKGKPIRNYFEHIWFVSIDGWKNEIFEQIFKE